MSQAGSDKILEKIRTLCGFRIIQHFSPLENVALTEILYRLVHKMAVTSLGRGLRVLFSSSFKLFWSFMSLAVDSVLILSASKHRK